jgi:hypothetical protein
MIKSLSETIASFPRDVNCTQCFNHVIALVVKRLIRQFDVPKGETDKVTQDTEKELRELVKESDIEELLTQSLQDAGDDDGDVDDEDGLEDVWLEMSMEAREELDTSTRPVKMVLVKVSPLVHLCPNFQCNWLA